MNRRLLLNGAGALAASAALPTFAAAPQPEVQVFKNPRCGCCGAWAAHMRSAGFGVTVVEVTNAAIERTRLGMPERFASCHTASVDGYILEGHVPAAEVKRLLAAKPRAIGLAAPGMPPASPGMEVPGRTDPYHVLLIDAAGQSSVFAAYPK